MIDQRTDDHKLRHIYRQDERWSVFSASPDLFCWTWRPPGGTWCSFGQAHWWERDCRPLTRGNIAEAVAAKLGWLPRQLTERDLDDLFGWVQMYRADLGAFVHYLAIVDVDEYVDPSRRYWWGYGVVGQRYYVWNPDCRPTESR